MIADDLRELVEPDASTPAGGADMALQGRLEVITPLLALRPFDQSLNALTGGHGATHRRCHVWTAPADQGLTFDSARVAGAVMSSDKIDYAGMAALLRDRAAA